MKQILVVNVNWIGDAIFSSPIFKALKNAYPQARISCLAVPRVREILESVPEIDEIIVYDEKGRHWNPFAKLALVWKLRLKRFDAAFLLHRSLTRALLVFLAGIPQRIGYDTKGRGGLLTHIVEPTEEQMHRSDHYLHVIESFGVEVRNRSCQLKTNDEAQTQVQEILRHEGVGTDDYVVVLNPGGNWGLKRWPIENFSQLATGLVHDLNVKVVLAGAAKDMSLVKKMDQAALDEVTDLTGQTNLKQMMALMKRANVVISGDSGPLHIANGVGAEVIGIFGPTRPEITGPRGSGPAHVLQQDVGCNREACYHLMCPDNICMQSITVRDVLETVRQIKG